MKPDQKLYVLESTLSDYAWLAIDTGDDYTLIGVVRDKGSEDVMIRCAGFKWAKNRESSMLHVREATEEEIETAVLNQL